MSQDQERFANGIYRDCKWCGGKGCLACPQEAEKEYKRQFPNGPRPLVTIPIGDFDRLEISESTGGPSMRDAHGEIGVFAARILDLIKEQKGKNQ